MEITMEAELFSLNTMFGGQNKAVFKKTVVVEITREVLKLIMNKQMILEPNLNCDLHYYDEKKNIVSARGKMKSSTSEYMDILTKNGWILDKEAARHHKLPKG